VGGGGGRRKEIGAKGRGFFLRRAKRGNNIRQFPTVVVVPFFGIISRVSSALPKSDHSSPAATSRIARQRRSAFAGDYVLRETVVLRRAACRERRSLPFIRSVLVCKSRRPSRFVAPFKSGCVSY